MFILPDWQPAAPWLFVLKRRKPDGFLTRVIFFLQGKEKNKKPEADG